MVLDEDLEIPEPIDEEPGAVAGDSDIELVSDDAGASDEGDGDDEQVLTEGRRRSRRWSRRSAR